ncbi:DNA polymerase epsilon subunit [Mycena kentingensis (nom. inval.)]|nr:DNA polymerase epsilon subunit [Mycena kentingensis (nom. inval.)]
MADARQRTIIKVFRKYSNSLGPDALELLESILDSHEIEDEDVESSIDTLAREYNKQDDALMKVSVEVLQRVYESLQDQGQRPGVEKEALDPDAHLFLVDAFEMPLWHWSPERGTFERVSTPLTMSSSAESRVLAVRDRLNIIKQSVLRNEHFAPSTLPSRDRERLVTLRSTKQLLGRAGERFLLLGMLAHNKEGKLCIEDADGSVELDFSKLVGAANCIHPASHVSKDEPGDGLFTEGSFALVEGEYTDEATLEIVAIGQPPCETRETARSIYGHIDFLGKGATSLLEDSQLSVRVNRELADMNFFFLSDVWLDHPRTLPGLQKMFQNCIDNRFIPKLIVLCGNFTSRSISHGQGRDAQRYQENFDALADLIASYPSITRTTHFVLVPGPLDLTINATLPRRPLLSSCIGRLRAKIPKIHFGTNPCRLKFFNQEIVVFREDTMARMLRNIVGVKPDARSDDLKRFLVQSILDQGHLCPLTINIHPTLSDYDHAMRLYPLPTTLILADKYDRYKITYTGCHVFNPGSFVGGASYVFSTYQPAQMNSEECVLDDQDDE